MESLCLELVVYTSQKCISHNGCCKYLVSDQRPHPTAPQGASKFRFLQQ